MLLAFIALQYGLGWSLPVVKLLGGEHETPVLRHEGFTGGER